MKVSLNGYNVFEKYRTHKNEGGLLLYVKNYMKVVMINNIHVDAFNTLNVENDKIVYDEIKPVVKDKNAIICEDFNNPSINWSTLTADRERTKLLKLTEKAFLYQIVQTSIRGYNILDLIFTNDSDLIHACDVGNSDHKIVRIKLNL